MQCNATISTTSVKWSINVRVEIAKHSCCGVNALYFIYILTQPGYEPFNIGWWMVLRDNVLLQVWTVHLSS